MGITFEKTDSVKSSETNKVKIGPNYEHFNVYMIFNINMDEKFKMKSRLVADSHKTAPPL